MAEVDLIPSDYRRYRRMRREILLFGRLFALVLLALVASKILLEREIAGKRGEIERLKAGEALVLDQQRVLEELQKKETDLEARLRALDALRGGPPAERMFLLVDRAIGGETWFTDWKFDRAARGEKREGRSRGGGYFIMAEQQRKSGRAQGTRMEIKGVALSHAALADFVRGLLRQSSIADVKLRNTGTRPYRSGDAISYDLEVLVDSGVEL